jgi:hypothetical protein
MKTVGEAKRASAARRLPMVSKRANTIPKATAGLSRREQVLQKPNQTWRNLENPPKSTDADAEKQTE